MGRKTDKKRLSRAIRAITLWCRKNRDRSKAEQHKELSAKLRGHYAYYGITFNFKSLERFFLRIREIWYKWLNRRSDKRSLYWWQYLMYLKANPLPYPRIGHCPSVTDIYPQGAQEEHTGASVAGSVDIGFDWR